jgi:hypothetical protein
MDFFSVDSFSDSRFIAQAIYPVIQTFTTISFHDDFFTWNFLVSVKVKINFDSLVIYGITLEIFTKLSCIRRGFRSVPLNNDFNDLLEMSSLLIFLDYNKQEQVLFCKLATEIFKTYPKTD